MNRTERAAIHAALGDPHRLTMVDELVRSDRTFQELARLAELPGNLAAHHLAVLEAAGLIERHASEGDRRRRYVTLRRTTLGKLGLASPMAPQAILFVCTHNSARSQFAAALWRQRTGGVADSAGTSPAAAVHPAAVRAAARMGVDLADARPKGYDAVTLEPDLVISVCDRARETAPPFAAAEQWHWSVPDPVLAGGSAAFREAFGRIAERVDLLAAGVQ